VVLHASFKPGDPQSWWYEIDPHALTGDRPWREAIALLEREADAPLPQQNEQGAPSLRPARLRARGFVSARAGQAGE